MAIELKNICKSYDKTNYAVQNINLDIEDGLFVVLVGPSGCGKSTLLRMIAGLEDITKGELIIDGKVVNKVAPQDRDLAMVFQSYALYPHMTIRENIAYPLKLRKVPKDEIDQKVEEVSEALGIKEYLDRKPGQLSGGQKQRVALGRCIVRSPKAYLMDEPLSNLDAKLRVQMRTEISALHAKMKKIFIYVTHDQIEALTMGDLIVVMRGGKMQQVGTGTELYENPVNKFVADFIGSPSMNFLEFPDGKVNLNGTVLDLNIDKPIWFGIRPDKISLDKEHGKEFSAKVTAVELLGAENYIYIDVNGKQFLIRDFSLQDVKPGEEIKFYIKPEETRAFDKESELRIPIEF